MPDGKPANEFAFNAEPKNKEFAENIIAGKITKIILRNTAVINFSSSRNERKLEKVDQW